MDTTLLMRLFIAAEPPANIREKAADIGKRLASTGADLRPVPADNVHVTLKFLGEVAEAALDGIVKSIEAETGGRNCFRACLSQIGYFGRPGSIRTVICPFSEGREELAGLMRGLEGRLGNRRRRRDDSPPLPGG